MSNVLDCFFDNLQFFQSCDFRHHLCKENDQLSDVLLSSHATHIKLPEDTAFFYKHLLVYLFYLYSIGVSVLFACLSVYHICAGARGGQKMVLDPLELELQTIVCCCGGAGNLTQVSEHSALTDKPSLHTSPKDIYLNDFPTLLKVQQSENSLSQLLSESNTPCDFPISVNGVTVTQVWNLSVTWTSQILPSLSLTSLLLAFLPGQHCSREQEALTQQPWQPLSLQHSTVSKIIADIEYDTF